MVATEHLNLAQSPYKKDFPVFDNTKINGEPLVYLDTAASAQKPKAVIDGIAENYKNSYANVHRGIYFLSEKETSAFESARKKVADFIGAGTPSEIIFTKGATEALNLFIHSFAGSILKSGDEVLLTQAEHHANLVPWFILQKRIDFKIKFAPVDDMGNLDMEAYKNMLTERVKIVSVTQMSNVLGTIMPVKEMAKLAHANGSVFAVDGSQGITHSKVNVRDIDCDFYAFSGHKLYAPTGIGVLYGKYEILKRMPVWQGGGDMVTNTTYGGASFAEPPACFEAGTPPFVQAIGLGLAIDYLRGIDYETAFAYEDKVFACLYDSLKNIDGIRIIGNAREKSGLVSFVINGCNEQDAAMILNQMGIAVRAGHHCAQPITERMGVKATIRASLGIYNDTSDVDRLVKGIEKVKSMLL